MKRYKYLLGNRGFELVTYSYDEFPQEVEDRIIDNHQQFLFTLGDINSDMTESDRFAITSESIEANDYEYDCWGNLVPITKHMEGNKEVERTIDVKTIDGFLTETIDFNFTNEELKWALEYLIERDLGFKIMVDVGISDVEYNSDEKIVTAIGVTVNQFNIGKEIFYERLNYDLYSLLPHITNLEV